MNVSFDLDGCLETGTMQTLCKKFRQMGAEIFITTSRITDYYGVKVKNDDLFELAKSLGIKPENIRFTEYNLKYDFMDGIDIHFDNDEEEVYNINAFPGNNCVAFLFQDFDIENIRLKIN